MPSSANRTPRRWRSMQEIASSNRKRREHYVPDWSDPMEIWRQRFLGWPNAHEFLQMYDVAPHATELILGLQDEEEILRRSLSTALPNQVEATDVVPHATEVTLPNQVEATDVVPHATEVTLPNQIKATDVVPHATEVTLPNQIEATDVVPHATEVVRKFGRSDYSKRTQDLMCRMNALRKIDRTDVVTHATKVPRKIVLSPKTSEFLKGRMAKKTIEPPDVVPHAAKVPVKVNHPDFVPTKTLAVEYSEVKRCLLPEFDDEECDLFGIGLLEDTDDDSLEYSVDSEADTSTTDFELGSTQPTLFPTQRRTRRSEPEEEELFVSEGANSSTNELGSTQPTLFPTQRRTRRRSEPELLGSVIVDGLRRSRRFLEPMGSIQVGGMRRSARLANRS
eukprot:CAMPEP_0116085480 /NCGR_PEP_ID=MMETSP0327-20121206/4346_1 /TAXON_ID=44447 /ORGANISM="Pseudo-nitzschia delicatissima, Strain B596" /LENGTH=392 /DNA_ID=CAMNT_0003576471 /DNA_START=344 /DNA_END=1522 /DNA_ORIENTATION=-